MQKSVFLSSALALGAVITIGLVTLAMLLQQMGVIP